MPEADYEANKQKVLDYLKTVGGKGADITANIAKGTGMNRREASKVLHKMELDGLIQAAGVMAGVAGYKIKE